MGAPAVIAVPTKSYVAINSYKSDRSLTSTMCDLGRVSNLTAAVTLPRSRTSNFVNRNSAIQSVRSLPHKKRPFAEVMEHSSSRQVNVPREMSTTNGADSHKRRRIAISSHSSTYFITAPTTMETNIARNHDSIPQAKVMNLKSTNTIRKVNIASSPDMGTVNGMKNNSVSNQENTQRNMHTQIYRSAIQSHISPPNPAILQSVQLRSQEAETSSHLQIIQHSRANGLITHKQPSQHNVKLQMSAMGQFPIQHSLAMQLQQQNQQLVNENMQLQKQLSLFRQLMKNPQRLNQVLTRLEQRAQ